MKKLLTILLILSFLNSYAIEILSSAPGWGTDVYVIGIKNGSDQISAWVDFTICTGSGSCSLTSMSGHSSGDVAQITAGSYSSGNFANLIGITFEPLTTVVTFTGAISVSHDSLCQWLGNTINGTTYGFVSTSSTDGFTISGQMVYCRWWNWEFNGIGGNCFDLSSNFTVYDGVNDNTKALRYSTIGNCYLNNANQLMQGTYSLVTTLENVIDSVSIINPTIVDLQGVGNAVQGNGVYRLLWAGGTVSGNVPHASGDEGIVQIVGNCTIYGLIRNGGYGYILRICTACLNNTTIPSYLYLVIDVNSKKYGSIDCRSNQDFPGNTYTGVSNLVGGDMYVSNLTTGNKKDTSASPYTAVPIIIGDMSPTAIHVRNIFSYNCTRYQANSMFQVNTAESLDTADDKYWYTANGNLKDSTTTWMPLATPLLNLNTAGANQSSIFTNDIYGTSWAGVYGNGAVKYVSQSIINVLIFKNSAYLK